ncbi:serine/threonine-protein kinase 16-like [Plakobranchus ocellatus]|uniref:non-specific serine/threonine protein kinase n=1 Tax=Plakobranchus ocellatus TaxID=259542 RepID=A0AAV4D1A3_9GAST|nr:serine/threonine-protein kinase 16-like [Plakobranchus ocellatus]
MGCFCGKEALTVGDRKFYLKQRLGEGGFSYVDLVEESTSRKPYALKRILCHNKEEESIALQEVEIMRAINHPNVIPLECYSVHKVSYHSKAVDIICEVFLVAPLYKNGTLQNRIDTWKLRGEHLPEDQIWNLMKGISQGLKALHDHKPPFAHRDLKPDNIMTEEDGTAVVMDLGSATQARVEVKTARQATQLQDLAAERCSMLYRPPELFTVETNTNIDERTDVWSLGCVLYALAYLESPFESAYQKGDSLALATMAGKITFPQDSQYSQGLQDCIMWMVKPKLEDRPFIQEVLNRISSFHHVAENRV